MTNTDCWCLACRPITFADMRMVVCPTCGDKRCVHAKDHRAPCAMDDLHAHNAWIDKREPWDMALCERHALVLRVGQPYVFRPIGGCRSCAAAVEAAREAYGDGLGAPA